MPQFQFRSKMSKLVTGLITAGTDFDSAPVDIYAIGFEEIVDLNASNIMSAR